MSDSWERIVNLIPASRRSTPEQQRRLMDMQFSLLMGVKALDSKAQQRRAHPSPPSRFPLSRHPLSPPPPEEDEVEDEDEDEDEANVEDEEGDDAEILAMKAEIRALRAAKAASPTSQAAPSDSPAADHAGLAQLVRQVVAPSLDDPD